MKIRNLFTFALAGLVWTSSAQAQQDPTRIGAGQLPYIMVILDTSGSMEYTDDGDETYPEDGSGDEWVPGSNMGLDPSSPSPGPDRFGPCFIWEPESCGDYQRPGWRMSPDIPEWGWDLINDSNQSHLRDRWDAIRGSSSTGIRLNPLSQPRHVTMKEILTGDMVLWTEDQISSSNTPLNPQLAPGCWFVPRQRDASIQSIDEQNYCSGQDRFEKLPDHAEPRPHFQETFDAQLDNGLLDVLSTSAIFAVGMLDGYREEMNDWPDGLNDDFDGNTPSSTAIARTSGTSEDQSDHYNLGLYQVVGPKKIDIPNSYLAEISRHVQVALVDSGYVHRENNDPWKLSLKEKGGKNKSVQGRAELGLTYSSGVKEFLDEDVLGKQPVARATPLAAAVMDARQFIENDDRFSDDPYQECRSKQVVIVTDGFPDPELPGGAGSGLGSEGLAPIFGYTDLSKYNYATAEDEIHDFVHPTSSDYKFMSRVHVVALNAGADSATTARIADKMSEMAIQGQTCASYALGPDWMPAPHGSCDPATRACLVGGQRTYSTYVPPDGDGSSASCLYPALILSPPQPGWTSSYRDFVQEALASTLGAIVGGAGVASRTRAVVSDFLDDDSLLGGGQYRVYSGSRIQGSAFWRGILNRETLPCDTSVNNSFTEGTGLDDGNLLSQALHEDIGEQVKCGPVDEGDCSVTPADNRRIFTSIPADELWDFDVDNYGAPPSSSYDTTHPVYQFRYDMMKTAEAKDEFRGTTLPGTVQNPQFAVGTRIPLYGDEIEDVLDDDTDWRPTPGLLDYFAVADSAELNKMFNVHRGRVPQKATGDPTTSRVLTGILNGNPVVVPPPIRDIPIESYRLFRATYGDRPTMMYAPTMDGQLHAIHVGELTGRIAVRDFVEDNSWADSQDAARTTAGASPDGTAAFQREAWAYIPNMVLRQLGGNSISQPYWMDGSPVVKDVRLCQPNPERNQNFQACRVLRDTAADESQYLTGDQQWRTVLVQGMGEAGTGYFAMDVTRTGGLRAGAASRSVDRPDPVVLWELTPEWETLQVRGLLSRNVTAASARVAGPTSIISGLIDAADSQCDSAEKIWSQSLMGKSVSQPEIATIVVGYVQNGNTILEQRPVAVFGGGLPDGQNCGLPTGSAVYVVDLQTGSILRRFVHHMDGSTEVPFASENVGFTGSPTLYDSNVGAVATRGYIGDTRGRIFKIDLTSPNPEDWEMVLAVDPASNSEIDTSPYPGIPLGPAAGKPAIAVGPSRQLVVTYGLGEPGDTTTAGQLQAVISFEEDGNNFPINWYKIFPEGEKMTGDPLVFNRAVYFPTYAAPPGDACVPGAARIYGVNYYNETGLTDLEGVFDPADPDFEGGATDGLSVDPAGTYFQLDETLIRGLTLTLGPVCTGRGIGDATSDLENSRYAVQQPQLIAQTGAAPDSGMSVRDKAPGGADAIGRITKNLARKRGPVVPLNWSLIY